MAILDLQRSIFLADLSLKFLKIYLNSQDRSKNLVEPKDLKPLYLRPFYKLNQI